MGEDRCGILLAAGASRRMGLPKGLLPWPGSPHLLAHNLYELLHACDYVVVVLGAHFAPMRQAVERAAGRAASLLTPADAPVRRCSLPGLVWVENRGFHRGRSSSVRAGVSRLPPHCAAMTICSVDQPLAPGLLTRLFNARQRHEAPLAVPIYQGETGHPPVFAASLASQLAGVSEARQGLRAVVEGQAEFRLDVPVSLPSVLWNLNRMDDYRRAREAWVQHRPGEAAGGGAGARGRHV